MGAFDGLALCQRPQTPKMVEHQSIQRVDPVVGNTYIMEYFPAGNRTVVILGIFDELIVVRCRESIETYAGERYEEAVLRRNASFFEMPSVTEVTASAYADTKIK